MADTRRGTQSRRRILAILDETDGLTYRELAALVDLSPGQTFQHVRVLEKQGYVQRGAAHRARGVVLA